MILSYPRYTGFPLRTSSTKIFQTPLPFTETHPLFRTFINKPFISQARPFATKKPYSLANIELNCLIRGDTPAAENVFPVEIARSRLVGSLKEQIIQKNPDVFKGVGVLRLKLWGVSIPLDDNADIVLRQLVFENNEPKGIRMLLPAKRLSTYFPDKLVDDHVHVIVEPPIALLRALVAPQVPLELERKRKAEEYLPEKGEKKKFTVNGAIRMFEVPYVYYVDPAENEENERFLTTIKSRQLLMLMGARASGKSTRLFRLRSQLARDGYRCYYVSLEEITVRESHNSFWTSLGDALHSNYDEDELKDIGSSRDFLKAFIRFARKEDKIVLLIDEFDKLYNATEDVRDECLETFRAIRNNNDIYAIHSIVACGTFSIQHLNATDARISPFNVAESLTNPYFSARQTQRLFGEFARDHKITIDQNIVDDIYLNSNGHPGMVCLCGRAIAENILTKVDLQTRNLAYKTWLDFSTRQLDERIHSYRTFRRMVDSLQREEATDAVTLLRSDFIGFLGDVYIEDDKEIKQAEFLTAEGVLLKPEIDRNRYRMASALVDSFIRRHVIRQKYPNAPSTPIPKHNRTGRLDILEILKESLKFFDKDLIELAELRSYKTPSVRVDCNRNTQVPRESVYDTELMRILMNWLGGPEKYRVTGQWHLRSDDGSDKYSDIVIDKPKKPMVVLELLATGDSSFIKKHIDKAPDYKNLLFAEESWVVHFTREDGYLGHPNWQSDDQMNEGVNVVHFWHDKNFKTVRMSARWKDVEGNIQKIDDQQLAL